MAPMRITKAHANNQSKRTLELQGKLHENKAAGNTGEESRKSALKLLASRKQEKMEMEKFQNRNVHNKRTVVEKASSADMRKGQVPLSESTASVSLRALIHMFKLHQQESYFKTFLMQVTMLLSYIGVVFIIFDSESCWFQNDIVNQHILEASFTRTGDLRAFDDVNDFVSFWEWFDGPVMDNIYPEALVNPSDLGGHADPNSLLYNKYFHMMGTFQIRQVRVENSTKRIDDVPFTIWPEYSSQHEDERRPDVVWNKDVAAYVKHPKHNTMDSLPEVWGNPKISRGKGYGNGGYVVDLDSNFTRTRDVVRQLKEGNFLDQGTRVVLLEVNFFNPNSDIITILHAKVEFFASGWVNTHSLMRSAPYELYYRTHGPWRFMGEIVFLCFLVWRLQSLFFTALYQHKRRQGLRALLKFSYLGELLNTMIFIFVIVFFFTTNMDWNPKLSDKHRHQHLYEGAGLYLYCCQIAAMNVLLSVGVIFKYLSLDGKLSLLLQTFIHALDQLFVFTGIIFMVLVCFGVAGQLIFGFWLKEFMNSSQTSGTLTRMLLGDFNYDDMSDVSVYAAPMFFFLYILTVVLVSLNVFIAILSDGYSVAKERIEREKKERTFRTQSFVKTALHLTRSYACKVLHIFSGGGGTSKQIADEADLYAGDPDAMTMRRRSMTLAQKLVPEDMQTDGYMAKHGSFHGDGSLAGEDEPDYTGGGGSRPRTSSGSTAGVYPMNKTSHKQTLLLQCQRKMYKELGTLDSFHKELLAGFMFNQHTLSKDELDNKLELDELAEFVGDRKKANALLVQFERMYDLLDAGEDDTEENLVETIEEQVVTMMAEIKGVRKSHSQLLRMQQQLLAHHGIMPAAEATNSRMGSVLEEKKKMAEKIGGDGPALRSRSIRNRGSAANDAATAQSSKASVSTKNDEVDENVLESDSKAQQWTKLKGMRGLMVISETLEKTSSVLNRTMVLMIVNFLAVAAFTLTLSGVGYGIEFFDGLKDHYSVTYYCIGAALGIFIVLYLLDFSYWRPGMRPIKQLMMAIAFANITVGACVATSKYPVAPVALFIAAVPFNISLIKSKLYPKVDLANFMHCVSFSLLVTGVIVCTSWVYWWYSGGKFWGGDTKLEYARKLNCDALNDAQTAFKPGETTCLAAFLIWASPFMLGMACLIFGTVCNFLAKFLSKRRGSRAAVRVFAGFVALGVFGMWVGASVAGASSDVADLIITCAVMLIVMTATIVGSVVGWHPLKAEVEQNPFLKKLATVMFSDWVKALAVVTLTPPYLFYLVLSVVNQFFRVRLQIAKDVTDPAEVKLRVTLMAHKQLVALQQWRWTSVCVKVMYLGLFFIVIDVGVNKVVQIFLSWLNTWIADQGFDLATVTAVFVSVGLVMFLLPPVPGVPVYLAGGVILVKAAMESMDFGWAVVYTTMVCCLIKFMAIAMQQKLIGEQMSDNVTVKCLVGVNSVSIRAIEQILSSPGVDRRKVAILCGGPDWPTSVLTGILQLRLLDMLAGSVPVLFLVAPCVCAGAFMLRMAEEGPWESLSTVTLAIATLTQSFALFAAMYYVEKVAHENKEALLLKPKDEEVACIEEERARKSRAYMESTDWHKAVPAWMRVVVVVGAFANTLSCYTMTFFKCFRTFNVTDTIEDALDGDVLNIVIGLGPYALYMAALSIVCLQIFRYWASFQVKRCMKGNAPPNSVVPRANSGSDTGTGSSADSTPSKRIEVKPSAMPVNSGPAMMDFT